MAVAEQMQSVVPKINEDFGLDLLRVGMGVTAGMVYTSVVGSKDCKDYTVMGEAVNLSARLQDRAGPGEILVSEEVYEYVRDRYPDAPGVDMELKGIKGKVHAFSLGGQVSNNLKKSTPTP